MSGHGLCCNDGREKYFLDVELIGQVKLECGQKRWEEERWYLQVAAGLFLMAL